MNLLSKNKNRAPFLGKNTSLIKGNGQQYCFSPLEWPCVGLRSEDGTRHFSWSWHVPGNSWRPKHVCSKERQSRSSLPVFLTASLTQPTGNKKSVSLKSLLSSFAKWVLLHPLDLTVIFSHLIDIGSNLWIMTPCGGTNDLWELVYQIFCISVIFYYDL